MAPTPRKPRLHEHAIGRALRSIGVLLEPLAWIAGAAALIIWAVGMVSSAGAARQEIKRFATLRAASESPDLSLWSPQRIRAWQEALTLDAPPPLALLRIRRIGLEVAVLEGTDEWTLNRAVGLIEETAKPGADGNSGIAGHRDGFFRGLKDVHPGDLVELDTLEGAHIYRVERIWIVDPDDVSVLDPTPSAAVTLVTCYPFYFVGPAPQRYIVRAVRVSSRPTP
jgi:sortase A